MMQKIVFFYGTQCSNVTSLNPVPGRGALTGDEPALGGKAFGDVDSVLRIGIRCR